MTAVLNFKDPKNPLAGAEDCFCGLPLATGMPKDMHPWWVKHPLPGAEWVTCMWCGGCLPLAPRK